MTEAFTFTGHSAGPAALRTIAPGEAGLVAAVFRRSLYLRASGDRFACIGPDAIGDGPLNLLIDQPAGMDWPASGCSVGMSWSRSAERLLIGTRFAIDLSAVVEWRPSTPKPASDFVAAARRLRGAAEGARGLGRLIDDPAGDPPGEDGVLFRAARPAIQALRAFIADPARPIHPVALNLVGLGPGLTPAGDDVLGAVMIASRALGWPDVADRLAETILPAARSGTTPISLAHLACAADGIGARAVHELLGALCGDDEHAVPSAIAAIDRIGHSSGWDATLGLALVLDALAERQQACASQSDAR